LNCARDLPGYREQDRQQEIPSIEEISIRVASAERYAELRGEAVEVATKGMKVVTALHFFHAGMLSAILYWYLNQPYRPAIAPETEAATWATCVVIGLAMFQGAATIALSRWAQERPLLASTVAFLVLALLTVLELLNMQHILARIVSLVITIFIRGYSLVRFGQVYSLIQQARHYA
jgi:hypothetical protein